MQGPEPLLMIPFSFLAGVLLTLMPLPEALIWWRPEWLLILLVFWVLNQPSIVGIWTAFILGLLLDLMMNTRFGVYPVSMVTVAWLARFAARRMRNLSLLNTSGVVAVLVALALAMRAGLELLLPGSRPLTADYWLPVISSALCWPLVMAALQRWGKY